MQQFARVVSLCCIWFALASMLGCEAQANGPCEDAVAKDCPGKTGAACKACVKSHKEDLAKVCNNFPHDPLQACGTTPSPSPGPGPSPQPPSPPSPSPSPSPQPPSPINPSKENCDSEASCSPTSFCSRVSNKACSFPDPDINMAKEIKSLKC